MDYLILKKKKKILSPFTSPYAGAMPFHRTNTSALHITINNCILFNKLAL